MTNSVLETSHVLFHHHNPLIIPICCCLVTKLCPTLCSFMDCSLPGFSVHGIFQGGILEWFAISTSRVSSWPQDQTQVTWIGKQMLYYWVTWEALFPFYRWENESSERLGKLNCYWQANSCWDSNLICVYVLSHISFYTMTLAPCLVIYLWVKMKVFMGRRGQEASRCLMDEPCGPTM